MMLKISVLILADRNRGGGGEQHRKRQNRNKGKKRENRSKGQKSVEDLLIFFRFKQKLICEINTL